MATWLVLDIGNTHTVAGLTSPSGAFSARARFRTDPHATADEYRAGLQQIFSSQLKSPSQNDLWSSVDRVIVSSVVPMLDGAIRAAVAGKPLLFINSETKREFALDLPQPSQLGADRLANVAGALTLTKGPFLIVDAGTATTFCLIDPRPAYIGGSIVPGLELSWKALASRAAKLFSVELVRPASVLGRDTESQIQAGVLQGYEALIEGMTDRMLKEFGTLSSGSASAVQCIATGGCVNMISLSSRFRHEPDLTLKGLVRYGQLTA